MIQTFKPIKKRLGDLLVDTGLITSSQLSDALELKNRRGIKIGRALLELKYVSEDLLLAFLGRQCGISYVSLKEFGEISQDAIAAVPEYLAREWEVFPLSISSDGKITVAASDPFNLSAIDDLRLISGCEVKTVIAPSEEIKNFIEKYYVLKGLVSASPTGKNDRNYVLRSLLGMAVSLGATDIYLSEGTSTPVRATYFLSRRHLKTVDLSEDESASIRNFFKKTKDDFVIFESGGGGTRLISDGENSSVSTSGKNPRSIFGAVFVKPKSDKECCPLRIKIRELPQSPSHKKISELGIAPDDIMVIEKHLASHRGIIVVSSAPSCGKTYFLNSAALSFNSPHQLGYYFTDDKFCGVTPWGDALSSGFCYNGNSPIISASLNDIARILPAPADVIFCDSSSEEIISSVSGHSDNSLVVLSSFSIAPEAIKKFSAQRLYIRIQSVRRLCPECRVRYAVSASYLLNSGIGFSTSDQTNNNEDIILTKSTGCESCGHTGYKGFTIAYYLSERLPLENKSADLFPLAREIREGMLKSLWALALKGEISIEEVIFYKNAYA